MAILVTLELCLLDDTRPFVLLEPGTPFHIALVCLLAFSGAAIHVRSEHLGYRTRGIFVAVHLLCVAVAMLARPFAPVFERDGTVVVLGAYLLLVLWQEQLSVDIKLGITATLIGLALLEGGLAATALRPASWTRLPDYGDLLGSMKRGGVLKRSLNLQVVGESGPVRFETDRFGFRNRTNPRKRRLRDGVRILLVGDSFLAGYRIDQESTAGKQLEAALAAAVGQPVEVLIAAIGGPSGYVDYLEQHGAFYNPDLVLVGLTLGNDIGAVYANSLGLPLEEGPIAEQALPQSAYKSYWSAVPVRIDRSLRGWRWYRRIVSLIRPAGITSWHGDYPGRVHTFDGVHGLGIYLATPTPAVSGAFSALEESINALSATCNSLSLRCALVMIAQRFELHPDEWRVVTFDYGLRPSAFDLTIPRRTIDAFCGQVSLICVDPSTALKDSYAQGVFMRAGDMHWSTAGNEVVASYLAATIGPALSQLATPGPDIGTALIK